MGYDDFKTETDLDYYDRMGIHRHGTDTFPAGAGGTCACGSETLRSVAGIGWQCHDCGSRAFHQLFQRGVRKTA